MSQKPARIAAAERAARSVEEWAQILKLFQDDPTAAGNRVIGDLMGYRHHLSCRPEDAAEIGRALQAWATIFRPEVQP